jgi:hypothetical protein
VDGSCTFATTLSHYERSFTGECRKQDETVNVLSEVCGQCSFSRASITKDAKDLLLF